MREIKFRAWYTGNSLSNYMMDWQELKNNPSFEDGVIFDSEFFKVMQYTGLKDRDGKEIYEGDIVKVLVQGGYSAHFQDQERIRVVTYNNERAFYEPFHVCKMYNIELIGNVYENKDLIE